MERIDCAAIILGDQLYLGKNHAEILRTKACPPGSLKFGKQGFATTTGRFVNRKEAFIIASKANQINKKHGQLDVLYSEDINEH